MFAIGAAVDLFESAGLSLALPSGDPDPGMIITKEGLFRKALPEFVQAIGRYRHFAPQMDPPEI